MGVHFRQFSAIIQQTLREAHSSIKIAVSWFTHKQLFELILSKLGEGVQVTIVLEYDNQNFKPGGLDWGAFLKAGGHLHGNSKPALMHHKFAIFDDKILLSGTFNWTHNQNSENIFYIVEKNIISSFLTEWNTLIKNIPGISSIDLSKVKSTALFPFFENPHFTKTTLRQMVARSSKIWIVKPPKKKPIDFPTFSLQQQIMLDQGEKIGGYWMAFRHWHPSNFRKWISEPEIVASNRLRQTIKRWMLQMKPGDCVLHLSGNGAISGFGVIQSDPKSNGPNGDAATYREVQWVRVFQEPFSLTSVALTGNSTCFRYRGSSMALLESIC